uniref:Uncharacterized protein n=1 Tax=Rhodosorus marinus TaxID=101924 RepID=A0A7S0G4H2_9RHOD|mmetsp:Transcript_20912/g.30394  ORF Transcript_20912/g.30394 Transcript_20912/m.30394 type:complete len:234 (+) Transcript_20912:72-773(+)
MPIFTIIGRLSDGLTLTQSMASQSDPYRKEVQEYERQAKKLLISSAHDEQKSPLYNQNSSQPAPYVTAEAGDQFCFHYTSGNGVCFLTLTEKNYPRRLAYDYLNELRNEFLSVYRDQIASASRPYEFIRFDSFIQKTKKLYTDSRTERNLEKLNSDLRDVHSIMTKNINQIITRGENLQNVTEKSSRLGFEAQSYAKQAAHANRMRLIRQYAPGVVTFIIVLLLLYFFVLRGR